MAVLDSRNGAEACVGSCRIVRFNGHERHNLDQCICSPCVARRVLGQSCSVSLDLYLGALDVAALSIRSTDGSRLEKNASVGTFQHDLNGGDDFDHALQLECLVCGKL